MKLTKRVNELAQLLREAIAELSEYRTGTEDDVDIVKLQIWYNQLITININNNHKNYEDR